MSNAQIDKKELLKWAIVLAVAAMIWLIPCNMLYTIEVKKFLLVTVTGILLVAFELVELMAVSMMFPLGYLVLGLVPMDVAYSAWLQTMPLVVVGGYLIANILDRIGLLKRIAYWCILRVGGSYYGLLYGVFIAGCILNVATGGNAWVIMAAFTLGLCKAFDLGKSIDSALIMFVGALSAGASCVFLYTPYFMGLLLNAAEVTTGTKYFLSWLTYFTHMAPYLLFVIAFIWLMPKMFKPTKKLPGKEFYKEEYEKLGKMSHDEKIGGLVTVALIVFMLTGDIHHIALDWAFIVIPWLMYFPGLKIGKAEDVQRIDFGMVFFCVACLSIGITSGYLGIGKMVADFLIPVLQPLSSTVVAGAIYLLAVLLNLLLTPFAILAGFSEPIAQIAQSVGIDPLGALYAMYVGCDQVFLPHEYLTYMIFYAFGLMRMADFVKLATTKTIFATVFTIIVLIPWWKFMGVF